MFYFALIYGFKNVIYSTAGFIQIVQTSQGQQIVASSASLIAAQQKVGTVVAASVPSVATSSTSIGNF